MVSHTAEFSLGRSPKAVTGGVLPHQGYEPTTIGRRTTTTITNAQGRPRKPTAPRQAAGASSPSAAAPLPVTHHHTGDH